MIGVLLTSSIGWSRKSNLLPGGILLNLLIGLWTSSRALKLRLKVARLPQQDMQSDKLLIKSIRSIYCVKTQTLVKQDSEPVQTSKQKLVQDLMTQSDLRVL